MTTLYGRVNQNIKLSAVVSTTCVILAGVALVTSIGLGAMHNGFDIGYETAKLSHLTSGEGPSFSPVGIRTYQYLASIYEQITLGLFLVITTELLRVKFRHRTKLNVAFRTFELVLLALAAYELRWIFAEKSLRSQTSFWQEPYDWLLRSSVLYDWIIGWILGILLVLIGAGIFHDLYVIDRNRSLD